MLPDDTVNWIAGIAVDDYRVGWGRIEHGIRYPGQVGQEARLTPG